MKFVDEKCRLFGIINLFDLFVLLFIVFLIPVLYLGYKIVFRETTVTIKEEYFQTDLNCKFIKVTPESLKKISVGDRELNVKGVVIGEIVWLGEVRPYQYEFDLGAGQVATREDAVLKEVFVKLRIKSEITGNLLYYKGQPINIDTPFDFVTSKYTLRVVPAIIRERNKTENVQTEINCKFIKVNPELLKQISIGDKELNDKGVVIGEIVWLGEARSYKYEFDLGAGQVAIKEDAVLKEVPVRLKLNVEVRDNVLYYKNEQIAVNFPFRFDTKDYSLQAVPYMIKNVQEKWVRVRVKFQGVIPEIASIVKEGDMEKDSDDRTVANLTRIIGNDFSEILMSQGKDWVIIRHPSQKDLVLFLDILCLEKNGILYFQNYPVKIGNAIIFSTDLYTISGTVVGLEMK